MHATEDLAQQFVPKEAHKFECDRQVHLVRFSPCGRFLAGGDFDGKVRRWQLDAAEPFTEMAPLSGHNGWVQAIAFAPEAGVLFTADSWGRLSAWHYADEAPEPIWSIPEGHDGWIRAISVSPDGAYLATCGRDRFVRIRSAADGALVREMEQQPEDLFSVKFHPSGEWVVSGDLKGTVKVFETVSGTTVRTMDASALYKYDRIQDVGGVWCLEFDSSGDRLFCAGVTPNRGATVQGEPTVLAFDFATGEQRHAMKLGAAKNCYVHDLCWHRAGFLAAVTSGTPGTGQFVLIRPGDEKPFFADTKIPNCHSVTLHPDGKRIVVTATNKGSNGNGRRLDADGNYPGNTSPIHVFEWASPGG